MVACWELNHWLSIEWDLTFNAQRMELARCGSFHFWLSPAIGGWSWFWVAPPSLACSTPQRNWVTLGQGHLWGAGIWCGWVCDAIIRGIDVPTSDGCSTCTSRLLVWSLWSLGSLYWVAWWLDSTPLASSPKIIFQPSKARQRHKLRSDCHLSHLHLWNPAIAHCRPRWYPKSTPGADWSAPGGSSKDSVWLSEFRVFRTFTRGTKHQQKYIHYTAYTMEKYAFTVFTMSLRIHNLEIITKLNPIPV